ncbi:MAG: hypothetical protein SV062_11270 [Thermodesulfobacteriota bacterium]|nr:hypothetical protein [Thermodesulfobacteriota bacterium]
MEKVKYIWTEEYVGKRLGPEIPEEGYRGSAFNDKFFSKIETLPIERIKEIQEEKLLFLVKYAYNNSAFYKKQWDEAKVKPSDIKSLSDVTKLPILKQKHFEKDQAEKPPFGTAPTRPANEQFQYYQTSGTTGKPRLWTDTKQDIENAIYATSRALYAQGIRPGWRAFFAFPFPPFMGFWHIFHTSGAFGCHNVPKGPLPTIAWLRLILNLAYDANNFLVSTPTYALRQLETANANGINPLDLKIKKIIVSGEAGYGIKATNKLLTEGFGAQIHDHPGSTEHGGPILYSCEYLARPEELSDHINADYWLVEVLDPETLEPVEPDSEGKKVGISCITALSRFGLPAIRMLLGDQLTVIENIKCGCGRTMPVVKGAIKGRADDVIIIKGVNIYPSLVENIIREIKELSPEYRIKRTEKGGGIILAEPIPEIPKDRYKEVGEILQKEIKEITTVTMEVEIKEPGSLPRLEAKTKRVVKEGEL